MWQEIVVCRESPGHVVQLVYLEPRATMDLQVSTALLGGKVMSARKEIKVILAHLGLTAYRALTVRLPVCLSVCLFDCVFVCLARLAAESRHGGL